MNAYSQVAGKIAKVGTRRFSYYLRLRLIKDILKGHGVGSHGRLLDIGSADADYAHDLSTEGYEAICLDINHERLQDGRQNYPKIVFVNADAQKLPFYNNSFDIVTIMNTLRYIPNPSQVLLEVNRVLRDRGTLILICHNRYCLDRLLVRPKYVIRCFSLKDLEQMILESKFQIIEAKYIFIPPPPVPQRFLGSIPKIGVTLCKLGFSRIFPEIFVFAVKKSIENRENKHKGVNSSDSGLQSHF